MDVNTNEITFAWNFNGELARRSLRELADTAAPAAPEARPAAASAPAPAPAIKSAIGPGELTPQGTKLCDPNDNMPAGTVVGGFKKTVGRTPFGAFCIWDPVK